MIFLSFSGTSFFLNKNNCNQVVNWTFSEHFIRIFVIFVGDTIKKKCCSLCYYIFYHDQIFFVNSDISIGHDKIMTIEIYEFFEDCLPPPSPQHSRLKSKKVSNLWKKHNLEIKFFEMKCWYRRGLSYTEWVFLLNVDFSKLAFGIFIALFFPF